MTLKPREIWEKGTPLDDAWYAWSNEKLRAEYDALESNSPPQPIAGQSPLAAMASIVGSYQRAKDAPLKRAKIEDIMKSDLLEWLQEEDLFAYGFPVKPKAARSPRRIGSEFWAKPNINWDQNTAHDQGYRYQRIRIIAPEEAPELTLNPKIGRPSKSDLIQKHAYLLFEIQPEFINFSHKNKALAVRQSIKKENSDIDVYGKGFHEDTLRKHINIVQKQFE
ncbi:hypothetical protein [Yoonia sp.]|uniref:hypothetical protein n=1 Tax=Yoonia sp. TaxID=2212373 RepID=UPI00358E622F